MLLDFTKRPEAVWFLEPVDWKKLKIPLYPNIIKSPMDLGTILNKLKRNEFTNILEFHNDVQLVWYNAMKFNEPGSNIYKAAENLEKAWNWRFKELFKDPTASTSVKSSKSPRNNKTKVKQKLLSLSSKNKRELTNKEFIMSLNKAQLKKMCTSLKIKYYKKAKMIVLQRLISNKLRDLNLTSNGVDKTAVIFWGN